MNPGVEYKQLTIGKTMTLPVSIVTITEKIPVFKAGEPATSIEAIKFKFNSSGDECGYVVIAQLGLYEIGSEAIYIIPDYCLPNESSLFFPYTAPGGDPAKSRLGKSTNRIRALGFNFTFKDSCEKIYSEGILLPIENVNDFLKTDIRLTELPSSELLGVTKYEEPETAGSGLAAGEFPSFMPKTDETNIELLVSHVRRIIEEQHELGLTIKADGSSHTMWVKKIDDVLTEGVCSRSLQKKLDQSFTTEYKDIQGNVYGKYFSQEFHQKGWYNPELNDFRLSDNISDLIAITKEVNDTWVTLAKKDDLLNRFKCYCIENNLQLAIRSEMVGQGLKGSGNKLNPDAKSKQKLIVFGVDDISGNYATRLNYSDEVTVETISTALGLEYTKPVFVLPKTYEELCSMCDAIIKSEEDAGRTIEGIVIRTKDSNALSCKYMNKFYDSKK